MWRPGQAALNSSPYISVTQDIIVGTLSCLRENGKVRATVLSKCLRKMENIEKAFTTALSRKRARDEDFACGKSNSNI